MKIGIITFHWATNYGAVLQCFALQETLKELGHEVDIINYKPRQYDDNLWTFFRMRRVMNIRKYINDVKKESLIQTFREKYLKETTRYYTTKQLQAKCNDFDTIITGSDQVLNDSFLVGGEKGGSTAYYLDFGRNDALRICYAVSFGTTKYPSDLISKVYKLVQNFSAISCRERTGIEIFDSFGRTDTIVVPDPTFLLKKADYEKLLSNLISEEKKPFVYLLHGRYDMVKEKLPENSLISSSEGIEGWLSNIHNANMVVTNSFHGTVFCIQFHIPFVVVLPTLENVGMNDRFYTMLHKLGLSERMVLESKFTGQINNEIDWNEVDKRMEKYRQEGLFFLVSSLKR